MVLAFNVATNAPLNVLRVRSGLATVSGSSTFLSSIEGNHERSILRTMTLVDANSKERLSQVHELAPVPEELNKPDEDEVELFYPTERQYYQFLDPNRRPLLSSSENDEVSPVPTTTIPSSTEPLLQVRSTSFGCGKLGHQVWPSSLALSLLLTHEYYDSTASSTPRVSSILELGAGCGLPTLVCRDVLHGLSSRIVATDFWYEADEEFDKDRLVPETYHAMNLRYNVLEAKTATTPQISQSLVKVKRLDWYKPGNAKDIALENSVDLVIGSDLIYYPADLDPLWRTLQSLLEEGGASKIILVSPYSLSGSTKREAFPAFWERLLSEDGTWFDLETQELILYKNLEAMEEELEEDRFMKMVLSARR